jgi:hypothetical protein
MTVKQAIFANKGCNGNLRGRLMPATKAWTARCWSQCGGQRDIECRQSRFLRTGGKDRNGWDPSSTFTENSFAEAVKDIFLSERRLYAALRHEWEPHPSPTVVRDYLRERGK